MFKDLKVLLLAFAISLTALVTSAQGLVLAENPYPDQANNAFCPTVEETDYCFSAIARCCSGNEQVNKNQEFYDSDGNPIYPPKCGFEGSFEVVTLKPGCLVDRFGSNYGSFVAPFGTPFEQRALLPESYSKPYHTYKVLEPVEVLRGKSAPWFNDPGLGTQYKFCESINSILESGKLEEINGENAEEFSQTKVAGNECS